MATRTLAVRPPQTTRTLQTVPPTEGEQVVRVGEVEMTLPIPVYRYKEYRNTRVAAARPRVRG
jgi:hypothetical protein